MFRERLRLGERKKRILIVIGSLDLGGTEKQLLSILPLLNKIYEIDIYTTSYAGALLLDFKQKGIRVFYSRKTSARNKILKSLFSLTKAFMRFSFFIRKNHYDVIHFFLPGAYVLGGVAACLQSKTNLIMSRRSQNNYQKKHPILAKFEKLLHKRMYAVTANSQKVKEQLLGEGVLNGQIKIIYNGVDVSRFNIPVDYKLKHELDIDKESLVLTIIANLYQYKGHKDLFYALEYIKNRMPEKWVLLCIGRDAGEKQHLLQVAVQCEISEHVRFLDERRDIEKIVSITDIGILVSHEEGFSNAVLELMAGGTPMVVTDVGGNAEAIEDGYSGLVIPPKRSKLLANAIIKLVSDESDRELFGERALKKTQAEYTVEKCAKEYCKLYTSLIYG